MRSTAVWLSLLLWTLTVSGQTVSAQSECRDAGLCGKDETNFYCLVAESQLLQDAVLRSDVPSVCCIAPQCEPIENRISYSLADELIEPTVVCPSSDVGMCCSAEHALSVESYDCPRKRSANPRGDAVFDTCHAFLEKALPGLESGISADLDESIGIIIASLPSPFRTGTASLFDPALEGLIAALSDEHFIRDRSWLWDVPEQDHDEDGKEGAPTKGRAIPPRRRAENPASKKGDKAKITKTDCHGVLPGVMLFHKEGARENEKCELPLACADKIVVLLVGESPVWGLDQSAIRWAVNKAEELGPLNIVGPYFSGSATSMAEALSRSSSHCVRMASGTMTVVEQAKKLARFKPLFAVDTRASRRAVLADFVRELPESGRVALFREDATAFGSYSVTGRWLDFPISPSVSRLRSAHAALQRKRAEEGDIRTPPYLDATLDHDPTAPDLLPTTSPSTIIAEDLKFDGIVQVLRRHRVTNVGIHLHAAEDVIFATQHLRRAMPEVRPLLMAMDRTFLHPQYAATMDGSLVASAYIDLTIDEAAPDSVPTEHNRSSGSAVEEQMQAATNLDAVAPRSEAGGASPRSQAGAGATASEAGAASSVSEAGSGAPGSEAGEVATRSEAGATRTPTDADAEELKTSSVRVFSRDSGPGIYRATRTLFHRPNPDYGARLSESQRTSQLGVIRRGKVWPLTTAPGDEQTQAPYPVEFVGLLLFLLCLSAAWPLAAIPAAVAFVERGKILYREPQRTESRLQWASSAVIWLGPVAWAATAWSSTCSNWMPVHLANRMLAVLSGVSPLTEGLLGLGSVAVALAGVSLIDIRSSRLGLLVASCGVVIPPLLFFYQPSWADQPHSLTVEGTCLGRALGAVLLLSYIAVPLGLGALLGAYHHYKTASAVPGSRQRARGARNVTVSAACCLLLAFLFLAAVNEYPFHPGRVLESFAASVLVVTAGCAAFCYSHLASENSSSWKVWLWALIPLFIALGTYFPGLRHAIQEWFELRKTISSML